MAPSPTIRRLLKETAELSAGSLNPNPTFHAAPVSESNLHEWHFTLLGPPSPSPYAGGLYHGRITLPPTYPLKPPNFRFLTPSGRFEVNREICLSISGFHEETWMPAWGIRTALTALRSFMAEKGSAGQVGGMEAKTEVRERLARESKGWRCDGCGGRTNSDIMREWWEICKERGVKVEEEMSLEKLPEGMSLETREPRPKAEGDQFQTGPQPPTSRTLLSTSPGDEAVPATLLNPPNQQLLTPDPAALAGSSTQPSPLTDCVQEPSKPPDSNTTAAPGAFPQSSRTSSVSNPSGALLARNPTSDQSNRANRPRRNSTTNSPTITASAPALLTQDITPNNTAEDPSTVTIDRAIGALFVALMVMILKKIFYPAGGNGGGMEGLYMSGG